MTKKITILAFMLFTVCSLFAKKAVVETDMSMFGVAISVSDSVVYMTDVQDVSKVSIEKKNKFLRNRKDYSDQLGEYMNRTGVGRMTTLVSYSQKKKKIEKRYLKIKQRYTKEGYIVKFISKDDFTFTPVPEENEE